MAADIDGSIVKMAELDGPDRDMYSDPWVQARFRLGRKAAFRQGIGGAVTELLLANQPWGFSLHAIRVPITWWHGELDPITPLTAVKATVTDAPTARLVTYPGEGHTVGLNHGAEILNALAT